MKTNTIQEEKQIIRDFMGAYYLYWDFNDWNQLVVVIDRIEDILYASLSDDQAILNSFYGLDLEGIMFYNSRIEIVTDMTLVRKEALKFINWYTTNKA